MTSVRCLADPAVREEIGSVGGRSQRPTYEHVTFDHRELDVAEATGATKDDARTVHARRGVGAVMRLRSNIHVVHAATRVPCGTP